ncbi:hypothetical protein M758_12G089900 [Ceratodon purpureus]|nr:hypothetical protein M758_12G089900 [Ceratodon purpureus]
MDRSMHRIELHGMEVDHGQAATNSVTNNLQQKASNFKEDHRRKALREIVYLKNVLQGWKTSKLQLDKRFSTLSIALVLVISMLYNGAFSPPGGFVITTITVSATIQTSRSQLSHETPAMVFFYSSSIGFAFAVLGVLFVLLYTLIPTMEGQVTKSIDTFIAYVTDADEVGSADADEVSISYQDAICNNITKTLSSSPMKYFLRPENRTHKLQKSVPVNHKVLFDEVLEFHKKCLPGELEISTRLQQIATWFLLIALVATIGAYPSAILAADYSTRFFGPTALMLCLVVVGMMIPVGILWHRLDFDHSARRYHDRARGPIHLAFATTAIT